MSQIGRARRCFVDTIEKLQQPTRAVPILLDLPPRVVRLVYNEQIVRCRREKAVLIFPPPREMTRDDQHPLSGKRVFACLERPNVVGVRSEHLPFVESWDPEAELLEELVLPLPTDACRGEDQGVLNLSTEQQATQRHSR